MERINEKILELVKKKNPKWKYYGNVKINSHDLNIIYGSVEVSNEKWFWFNIGFILYNITEPRIQFTMSDRETKEQYKKYREKMLKEKRIKEKKDAEKSKIKMF